MQFEAENMLLSNPGDAAAKVADKGGYANNRSPLSVNSLVLEKETTLDFHT